MFWECQETWLELGYVSAVDSAGRTIWIAEAHRSDAESVSFCTPLSATGAAAHLREEFPHFCIGSVGKKVLLKAPPVE